MLAQLSQNNKLKIIITKSILKSIYLKLKKTINWSPKISKYQNLITIGSKKGGWTIPDDYLNNDSIVYMVGAGEDISFDVGIAEKYGSKVYIFDPTPRAKTHFNSLINGVKKNEKVPINNSKTDFYQIKNENIENLKFIELGLWNKEEKLKFYVPKNPEHVSHSLVNLQKTEDYFIAKVDRLSNIMKQLNHNHIDLLKIDIEGAEYNVIESILEDKIKIKVLCVEYDEAFHSLDNKYIDRIKDSITKLTKHGYKIIDGDSYHNYTFIFDKEINN